VYAPVVSSAFRHQDVHIQAAWPRFFAVLQRMGTLAHSEVLIASPRLPLRLMVGSFGAIEELAAKSSSHLLDCLSD